MIKQRRWPIPGDTALDAARSIAREYRRALNTLDPELCARLDQQAIEFGQTWLLPAAATHHDDDWIPLTQAAELVGRTRDMIYKWATRDHRITPRRNRHGHLIVRVGDILDTDRDMRRERGNLTNQVGQSML